MVENNFKKDFDPKVTGVHLRTDEEILDYSETKVLSNRVRGTYTICDIHRMIYKSVDSGDNIEETKYLLERAFVIAKKMDAKLRMYKHDYDDNWYQNEKKSHSEWIKELKE